MRSAPLVAALVLLGSVSAQADPIRLLQLDRYRITTVIDAVPTAEAITIRNDTISFWTPLDRPTTSLAVSWAGPNGVLGGYTFDFEPGIDVVVWGVLLPVWYHPTTLTVKWGAVGTTPQSASWVVQTIIPEPSAWLLVVTGCPLIVWIHRQRRRRVAGV